MGPSWANRSEWPVIAKQLATRIEQITESGPVRHVGLTSIPGQSSLDRIDLELEVTDREQAESWRAALTAGGFPVARRDRRTRPNRPRASVRPRATPIPGVVSGSTSRLERPTDGSAALRPGPLSVSLSEGRRGWPLERPVARRTNHRQRQGPSAQALSVPRVTFESWLSRPNTQCLPFPNIDRLATSRAATRGSKSSAITARRAISRPRSPTSSDASGRGRRTWCCSGRQGRQVGHHRLAHREGAAADLGDGPEQDPRGPSWPTSCANCSRTTPSNTSSPITTTTNPRRTSRRRTRTSRRTPRSTPTSSGCGTRRPCPSSPGGTSSWSPRCRASTGSAPAVVSRPVHARVRRHADGS